MPEENNNNEWPLGIEPKVDNASRIQALRDAGFGDKDFVSASDFNRIADSLHEFEKDPNVLGLQKLDRGNYQGTASDLENSISAAQSGIIQRRTLAEIQALPGDVNVRYEVTDGTETGKYSFDGTNYVLVGELFSKTDDINDETGKVIEAQAVKGYALSKEATIDFNVGKNKFNTAAIQVDKGLNNSGVIVAALDWGVSDYIEVEEGFTYVLSGVRGRSGLSFFANNTDTTPLSYSSFTGMPYPFIVPNGVTHIVFSVYQASNQNYSDLQFELGLTPSSYEPFTISEKIKPAYLYGETFIPFIVSLDSDTQSETYIENIIDGKKLRQEMIIFNNLKTFNNSNIYYDGNQLSDFNDEAAPYRIDGGTIGANHLSNGVNTNQNYKKRIFVDGIEIFDFKRKYYPSNSFTVQESYDIDGHDTSGIVATVSITNSYDSKGTLTIKTDFYAIQSVDLVDIMFIMSKALTDDYSLYIPKSLPTTVGSNSYDFSTIEDMTNYSEVGNFNLSNNRCEPNGIFCDRAVMFKNGLGMAVGYLPIKDAEIATRRSLAIEKALQIRSGSKKIYMSAIDPFSPAVLNVGDYYSVVGYKSFFSTLTDQTCNYSVDNNDDVYVYLDWHTSGLKRSGLPTSTAGRDFEVIEKSSGVDIKSEASTGSLLIDVALTNGYAYLILKF